MTDAGPGSNACGFDRIHINTFDSTFSPARHFEGQHDEDERTGADAVVWSVKAHQHAVEPAGTNEVCGSLDHFDEEMEWTPLPLERAAPTKRRPWDSPAVLWKEDRGVVARAVQNVNDINPLGGFADDPIENLVVAVNPVPHTAILVARHEWKGARHVCKAQTLVAQFPHETQGATRIVSGDVITDGLQLSLSGRQNTDDHGLSFVMA